MNFQDAFLVADEAVFTQAGRRLNDLEKAILEGAWQNQTYEQIAAATSFSVSYLKQDVGPKLWKLLSSALGEAVSKTNFQAALERRWRLQGSREAEEQGSRGSQENLLIQNKLKNCQDWGEALDVSVFYGRKAELDTLKEWILQDSCRLVALLGMGGIGKTALSVKLAEEIQADFEFVIWRSLRNAPPLETLLAELVLFLSNQQETKVEIGRLINYLRTSRCLLILDNLETILDGKQAGQFRKGYEGYAELLRVLGEAAHQSCVILTSREKPAEIAATEGVELAVRSLRLSGSPEAAQAILQAKGLVGLERQKQELCDRYGNSPLALKIVATSIQDLFDGEIGEFLAQDTFVFNGVRRLIEQQFNRLSPLENTIMYWLAINRDWTAISELREDIVPAVSPANLLEALEALWGRNLIEKQHGRYTQQSVVMEYITDRLVAQIAQELQNQELSLFLSHAITKTTVKDYVRQSQVRLILKPIAEQFRTAFSSTLDIEQQIQAIVGLLRRGENRLSGYGGGNLINLCCQLQLDLTCYDFSELAIWHAYLEKVNLQRVNFAYSDLSKSVFTQIFGAIFAVAFSPDGTILATGDDNSEIRLWRVVDGQPLMTLRGHIGWIWSVAFSPIPPNPPCQGGHSIPPCPPSQGGQQIPPDPPLSRGGSSIPLNPPWQGGHGGISANPPWQGGHGGIVASCCSDFTVRLWDLQTGQCLKVLPGHTRQITSVTFSPDGLTLASSSDDQTIRLWDVTTGDCLKILQGHTYEIWSVAFSPNGRILASGSVDRTIRLWDVQTGEVLNVLKDHTDMVIGVAFSPDGKMLASGSWDRTIRLWDVGTGKCCKILEGHTNAMRVKFNFDGQMLASGSFDSTLKLWNVQTGQCLKTLQGHTGQIWSFDWNYDGKILASGSADQTVKLWDITTGQCLKTLQGYTNQICSVAFSPDGQTLASGGTDQTVRVWNIYTGQCLKTLPGHTSRIRSIAFSPDGKMLASGSEDHTVKLWDTRTGQCWKILQGHQHWIWSVAFSPIPPNPPLSRGGSPIPPNPPLSRGGSPIPPNPPLSRGGSPISPPLSRGGKGGILASGCFDQTIRIWDIYTGECLHILQAHMVWSVAFSPDAQTLVSCGGDHTIRLWNPGTGEYLGTLDGHTNYVMASAFSPDGQILATGSADQTIRLWNLKERKCLKIFQETAPSMTVAFSPDGQTFATSSADYIVKLWDLKTGEIIRTFQIDTLVWFWSVDFSPDGQILATGSTDGTINLWDVNTGECVKALRCDRPYEGTNITGITGITDAQKATLKALGAIDRKL